MQARRLGMGAVMLAVLLLMAAVLSGRAIGAPQVGAARVDGAVVRLPIVPGRPAAGYFTLTGGARADRLVAVTTPMAGRVEMHSMAMVDGVMRMRAEPGFDVPARGALRFARGGNHLMLFDLTADAKPGARVPLTFRFQSGATLQAVAVAESANPMAQGAAKDAHSH